MREAAHGPKSESRSQRPTVFLILGALTGVGLAAAGLLRTRPAQTGPLPRGVVARVNGQLIRLDDYQRAVNALAQDRRSGVDAAQRRQVLDRLIEDELLLQRALELGLARDDLRVRRALTGAVIESVVASQENVQPSDAELQTFFDQEHAFFSSPGQLQVRQIWCRAATPADAPAASARAQQAADRVRAGDDFATVRQALGDPELAPIPDTLIPVTRLGDYLGPTAMRTVLTLQPGMVSEPVRSASGYHVLQVVDRRAADAPPLAEIKPQVLAELRRRAADQALRTYLDDLRSRADVGIAPDLP